MIPGITAVMMIELKHDPRYYSCNDDKDDHMIPGITAVIII